MRKPDFKNAAFWASVFTIGYIYSPLMAQDTPLENRSASEQMDEMEQMQMKHGAAAARPVPEANIDTNSDGSMDGWDIDGDGAVDLLDSDNDGKPDQVAPDKRMPENPAGLE